MKKKMVDDPMTFNIFRDSLMKLDSSLTPLQIKALFDLLKNEEGKVEIPYLLDNLTGEHQDTVDFKKLMAKKISDHIYSNGLMGQLKENVEKMDTNNEGSIPGDGLLIALKQLRLPVPLAEIEKYVRQVPRDNFGKINYQKLLLSYENSKQKIPLKAIGLRLVVFLKQNNLTSKTLIEKLLSTKK